MNATRSVLIVDDQPSKREQIAQVLKSNYDVVQKDGYDEAVEYLRNIPVAFILLDRSLATGPVEQLGLAEICAAAGKAHVIVYTDKDQLTGPEEYRIKERGAIRVIGRTEIANLDVFSRELNELLELSSQLKSFTGERSKIVAALVGVDVGVTIIDKDFHCWFANEQQDILVGGKCSGGLCWKVFHGRPADWGACWGCTVSQVISSGNEKERVFLSRLHNDELSWLRVRTKPVLNKDGKAIAAREAVSRLDPDTLALDDRLSGIAQGLLQLGFGRARIFRAGSDSGTLEPAAAAAVTDDVWLETKDYFATIARWSHAGNAIRIAHCPYAQRAHDSPSGKVTEAWDPKLGRSPYAEAMSLDPPYLDVPVWAREGGRRLVGWISADMVGLTTHVCEAARKRWLTAEALTWIREKFGAQLIDALEADDPGQQTQNEIIHRAVIDVGGANSVDSALGAVRSAATNLVPGCRVSVRLWSRGGGLVEYEDLCVGARASNTPPEIGVENRDSLAALAFRSAKSVWVNNRGTSQLPPGFAGEGVVSTASIPLSVEGIVVGTMSIDSSTELHWAEQRLVRPLEHLARIAALVVRDINLRPKTDREDVAAYAASTLRSYVERREMEEALRDTADYATALTASLDTGNPAANLAEKVRGAIENAQGLLHRPEIQSCRLLEVFDALKKRYMGKQALVFESADKPGEAIPEQFKGIPGL